MMDFVKAVDEVNKFFAKSLFDAPISKAQRSRTAKALGVLSLAANYAKYEHWDSLVKYLKEGIENDG